MRAWFQARWQRLALLAAIVGPGNILTTAEERWGYAYDATDREAMPGAVVFPGSAAEVAAYR